ncbi:MAG: GNAT family N-acetyltransferase [Pseudomonadota bacterium]|nr:GNAT family N-acetyltransferase [Pseudomonadota bacterium]
MSTIEISVLKSIREMTANNWDSCACPEVLDGGRPIDPFTSYRFLDALEVSGSVGRHSGWMPSHIVVKKGDEVVAVMPLYIKTHSQGEYIFDHNWSHAYNTAGGSYYPKLQSAVPFTPVTGCRFLQKPGLESDFTKVLVNAVLKIAKKNKISSFHVTFCTDQEASNAARLKLLKRLSLQYHWTNQGYKNFEDFLGVLVHRKRKAIKKERRTAKDFGGKIMVLNGDDIKPMHWDYFWRFYQDTGARKWGTPYLNRYFFDILHKTLRDQLLLIIAEKNGIPIAGALNLLGRSALYGRYWGCSENHSCLHYELCYYQAIDYAIREGLEKVEAGAQGDHKLARGYLPRITNSMHWFSNEYFSDAVARYIEEETKLVLHQYDQINEKSPFKDAD